MTTYTADRKGHVTENDSFQDRFLEKMYGSAIGRALLKPLVNPVLSEIGGRILDSRVSALAVPAFIRHAGIDMRDYEPKKYWSYNDFFTRRIRPGERMIAQGENLLISPCDGKATVCRIGADTRFYIKDTLYTAAQLLRNERLADHYKGGYAVILRLTVDDYHHYCYVADGQKSKNVTLPGIYHTVNPAANDAFPIYRENAREYTLIRTEKFGTIMMMEVGAMMVGKITNLEKDYCQVKKGAEKGYFEFGGSTIILFLQHGKVRLDSDLLENTEAGYETIVRMGERIGECKLSKRTGKSD